MRDRLLPFFEAWRVLRVGGREVTEGILAAPHRGPSPEFRAALDAWDGAWYWVDPARTRVALVRRIALRHERWWLHAALLLVAIVTTMGAGAALAGAWYPPPGRGLVGTAWAAGHFFSSLFEGDWRSVLRGWSFGVPLLAILLVHELGHYFAARRYAIDTSPPYFLPVPPTLSPIGSLGAFIRLRSPMLDRRQLMDVGAAGPLAGFAVAILVLLWGYAESYAVPVGLRGHATFVMFAGQPIFLGESLLTRALREAFLPGATAVHLSLPGFAGWVGAFITGLNLLPLSQLDGGHVLYGLLGRRQAPVAFVALLALVALAQVAPTWYVWVVLALVLGGGRWTHPSVVMPERPVPPSRLWIGWACMALFALTFVPFPFHSP